MLLSGQHAPRELGRTLIDAVQKLVTASPLQKKKPNAIGKKKKERKDKIVRTRSSVVNCGTQGTSRRSPQIDFTILPGRRQVGRGPTSRLV